MSLNPPRRATQAVSLGFPHGQWQLWDRGWEGVKLERIRGMELGWCQEKRE